MEMILKYFFFYLKYEIVKLEVFNNLIIEV